MNPMQEVLVADSTQVAEARRRASAAAVAAGFDAVAAGQVALAATELASNLVKHGGGGRLLIGDAATHIDLLALDRGPGMRDVAACLADGYSTAGTAGNGLGAVRRLARRFEVASWPGQGTAVFARLQRRPADTPAGDTSATVRLPLPGESACGDDCSVHEDATGRTIFMVDGLGHGTEAAVAARAAVAQFERQPRSAPAELLQAAHQAMRHTRGGAVAVARLEWASGTVQFAGLGNIAGTVATPGGQLRRMVSHNGTAGHNARKIQAFEYPCAEGRLIMHTDGIATSWSLDGYRGLLRTHPMLLAAVLYRDHARGRDDATVTVVDTRPPAGRR